MYAVNSAGILNNKFYNSLPFVWIYMYKYQLVNVVYGTNNFFFVKYVNLRAMSNVGGSIDSEKVEEK